MIQTRNYGRGHFSPKNSIKSKSLILLTVLIACSKVECGRGRLSSEDQTNETIELQSQETSTNILPKQEGISFQSFEPVTISVATSTRISPKSYETAVPGSLTRTDSDNGAGDNEVSSDYEGESDEGSLSTTNNRLYNAIMNRIPSGFTRGFNGFTEIFNGINELVESDQLNRYSDYHSPEQELENNVGQSQQSDGESSHEMDSSIFITRGSSNCNPSAATMAASVNRVIESLEGTQEDSERVVHSERVQILESLKPKTNTYNTNIVESVDSEIYSGIDDQIQQGPGNDADQDEMFNIIRPIEFNSYFQTESTPTAAAIQIAESSLSDSAARLRSNSPYVRSSRVNSLDSVTLEPLEMEQISELEKKVEENKTTNVFDDIDSIASERLQANGHVGLHILSQLLNQMSHIPLEPGTTSLQQSSDLLEQLSNVFQRVAKYCKGKRLRLDYCELIQWCLNATCMRNAYPDRFRLVRDAILLLILNNASIFDEIYLRSDWTVYSFKVATIYASFLNYYDSLDYIRQIYDCPSLPELLIKLELPDLISFPRDNGPAPGFLPLRQVYLKKYPAVELNQINDPFNQRKRNLVVKSVKKNKKNYQITRMLINIFNALLNPIIGNPGVCITAVFLAIFLQIFFFHGK